jgi:hypothetical protein
LAVRCVYPTVYSATENAVFVLFDEVFADYLSCFHFALQSLVTITVTHNSLLNITVVEIKYCSKQANIKI